jgi:serine/threonine protein phosphatase PrpC
MIVTSTGTSQFRQTSLNPGEGAANSSMLDIEFGEHSDIGKLRDNNEDAHGHAVPANPSQARSHGWFFVLADGVGGHERGEVASKLAVETVVEGFRAARANEPHIELLPKLVAKANLTVYEAGRSAAPGGAHMATTMVACALRHDRAVIAHVGDSRCYLIRRNHAALLTRDHTVANEHVRLGLITAAESAQSNNRHKLLRSLGHDLFVSPDINQTQVIPGDVLVLCCDGMHGAVNESDMALAITHHKDLIEAARELVNLANERDGSDNISVQLIRVKSVERVGMYRGRPYKLR